MSGRQAARSAIAFSRAATRASRSSFVVAKRSFSSSDDALRVIGVTVDVAGLEGGEALLDGRREGRDADGLQTGQLLLQCGCGGGGGCCSRVGRFQSCEPGVDSRIPIRRGAIPVGEAAVELVEPVGARLWTPSAGELRPCARTGRCFFYWRASASLKNKYKI